MFAEQPGLLRHLKAFLIKLVNYNDNDNNDDDDDDVGLA